MNDRIAFYVRSQLLGAGFSIIDGDLAFGLSCGLWPSVNNASMDFMDKQAIINRFGAGCSVLSVEIERREVLILARNIKNLKSRIEMLTGLTVGGIAPHVVEEVRPVPVPKPVDQNTAKIQRELRKDYNRQAAQHADSERRRQALDKAARHAEWKAERVVAAEMSRVEFYAKRGAADGR